MKRTIIMFTLSIICALGTLQTFAAQAPGGPAIPPESHNAIIQAQAFQLGKQAYEKGNYALALDILKPFTQQDSDNYLNGMANSYLAHIYLSGNDDIKKDYKRSRQYALAAFKNGIASAQELLLEIHKSENLEIARDKITSLLRPSSPEKNKIIQFLSELPEGFRLPKNKIPGAEQSINNGKKYLEGLYGSEKDFQVLQSRVKGFGKDFQTTQSLYINMIIDMYWALFATAVNKDQGFTGGTIVVKDKENKLFNFLLDYVKTVNAEVAQGTAKAQGPFTNNCFAYQRISSHFKELKGQPGFEQYGIDMRYGSDLKTYQGLMPLLPVNRQHLLFGQEGNELTFLKAETFGLCGSDAVKHGINFIKPKPEDIPQREDVPKNVWGKWDEFIKKSEFPIKFGKDTGIRDLYGFAYAIKTQDASKVSGPIKSLLESIALHASPQAQAAAAEFVNYIEDRFDNPRIRRGNEVILTTQDVLK